MSENTILAMTALKAAADAGIKHVFLASSAAVYGRPQPSQLLCESDPPSPISDYGKAKLDMEHAAIEWCQSNKARAPGLTCLRIGNVAGADQLLINALQATSKKPLSLDCFSSGFTPERSYIGPHTLAAVLISLVKAVAQREPMPEILNVAAPGMVSMAELLDALEIPWQTRPAPDTALPRVTLDTTRLQTIHAFSDRDSLASEMIRQVFTSQGFP